MRPALFLTALTVLNIPLSFSGDLRAQTLLHGSDVAEIAEIARGFGSATIETDYMGDPLITGRMDGLRYQVIFYGCIDGAGCNAIQFRATWTIDDDIPLERVNDWNRDYRLGKAYLDEDGDILLDWDINLEGGVSRRNLDDSFDWWRQVMLGFVEEMF